MIHSSSAARWLNWPLCTSTVQFQSRKSEASFSAPRVRSKKKAGSLGSCSVSEITNDFLDFTNVQTVVPRQIRQRLTSFCAVPQHGRQNIGASYNGASRANFRINHNRANSRGSPTDWLYFYGS